MYVDPRIIAALIDALGRPIAQALGNRFISRPDHSVPLKDLEADIQRLYKAQVHNNIQLNEINELLRLFLAAVERSDGLAVRNQRIIFERTAQSPNLGIAIMHLDEEIEVLRGTKTQSDSGPAPVPVSHDTIVNVPDQTGIKLHEQSDGSIFDGLEDEISRLRSDGAR
jgi:hypothetical protein